MSDDIIKDIDGNTYEKIIIGEQTWIAQNLNTTRFRNGDLIPEARTGEEWKKAGADCKPVRCYYHNTSANGNEYGMLYNWYAVNDPRGLSPEGWNVPSDGEWDILTDFLGGPFIAGGRMKSIGTIEDRNGYWYSPNTQATNERGFSGMPGGLRENNGIFNGLGYYGYWWSSTGSSDFSAWYRYVGYFMSDIFKRRKYKDIGLSVRCLKD